MPGTKEKARPQKRREAELEGGQDKEASINAKLDGAAGKVMNVLIVKMNWITRTAMVCMSLFSSSPQWFC